MDDLRMKEAREIYNAMKLTKDEIQIILEALNEKYGFGYSNVSEICSLQGKLSIMLEVAVGLGEKK